MEVLKKFEISTVEVTNISNFFTVIQILLNSNIDEY